MVSALAPAALGQGVQPDQKAPPTLPQGQGAQPDQKAPPAQTQRQGAQPDQKAPPQAERQGGQKDQAATIQARQPDMVLVSNLLNVSVYGTDNTAIGEIKDIIVKSDGKIEGMVVSVGGFLGLGEKHVALKMDRFRLTPQADGGARITVGATEQELREAPAFKSKQGQAS
jgi:sporulation protein YlmC with PRC-barrel domain